MRSSNAAVCLFPSPSQQASDRQNFRVPLSWFRPLFGSRGDCGDDGGGGAGDGGADGDLVGVGAVGAVDVEGA
jgi:hypothetical protein